MRVTGEKRMEPWIVRKTLEDWQPNRKLVRATKQRDAHLQSVTQRRKRSLRLDVVQHGWNDNANPCARDVIET